MAVCGYGECLGLQYPALPFDLEVQMFTVLILLHFSHHGAGSVLSSYFWVLPCLPQLCNLNFACHFIPHHPLNISIPDTTLLVKLARFFYLIWWKLLQAATSDREVS